MFSIFIEEYLQATKINNKLTIRSKMKGIPKYRQIVHSLWSWYICKRFRLCGCVIWQVLLTLCRGRGLFERDNHPMPRYWEKFSHIFAERYMLMLILLFVSSQSNWQALHWASFIHRVINFKLLYKVYKYFKVASCRKQNQH